MGATVMLNSKVKLGCNICDKCCVNRGDIKLTPINVIEISRFLNISINDFIEQYTERVDQQPLEIVIRAYGSHERCILNDENTSMCKIHNVKPMQCVTFPLVPLYIEKDIFYVQDSCECQDKQEIRVIDWLNGKDGIYMKYKKIYLEWIEMVEEIQNHWDGINKETQDEIFRILFYNYKENEKDIKKKLRKNMKLARKLSRI